MEGQRQFSRRGKGVSTYCVRVLWETSVSCVGPGRCSLGDFCSQPPALENKSQTSVSMCSYTGEASLCCST